MQIKFFSKFKKKDYLTLKKKNSFKIEKNDFHQTKNFFFLDKRFCKKKKEFFQKKYEKVILQENFVEIDVSTINIIGIRHRTSFVRSSGKHLNNRRSSTQNKMTNCKRKLNHSSIY